MWQLDAIAEFLGQVERHSGLHATVLAPSEPLLAEVDDKLEGFYSTCGRGYLNSDEHRSLDIRLGLRHRSRVVVVLDEGGRIVSTVRVTGHPFEAGSLVPLDAHVQAFTDHFELSRLVSWSYDEFHALPTALALGTALLFASENGACGLVALARSPQRRVFAKFGLQPVHASPFGVPIRENGHYWFLEAPISSVVAAAHTYANQLLGAVSFRASFPTF